MSYLIYFLLVFLPLTSAMSVFDIARNFDLKTSTNEILRKVNPNCASDMAEYLSVLLSLNFTDDTLWALQMLDSSAKIPEGLLFGSLVDMGNFDECLEIKHPSGRYLGKHCMVNIAFPTASFETASISRLKKNKTSTRDEASELELFYGICLPSSCSASDINTVFENEIVQKVITASATDVNCWTSENRTLSGGSWAFIGFTAFLLALAVVSTLYDISLRFMKGNVKPNQALCSFSIYSNWLSLFEIRKGNEDMSCLHGIRTITMLWVVLGHTYEDIQFTPAVNLITALDIPKSVKYTLINNSYYSVDTFFFLSGLLSAFVFFRNISKKGYHDVPTSYIHRYLRLTPQFLYVIVFHITLFEFIGNGPLWTRSTSADIKVCRESWWTSIIYLQNYIHPERSCLGQSWYLQADMQMFWIAPLLLYPIYLWPKFGLSFLGLLTIASAFWTFGIDYSYKFYASIYLNSVNSDDQFSYDYTPFHTRMAPWLVGIALGVAICAFKDRKVKVSLSKVQVVLGWTFSTLICLVCLFSMIRFTEATEDVFLEAAFFISFSRLGWGVGLAWIIFACIHGYGGIANTFLSIGIFQPLGKLSYIVYLVHIAVLDYGTGTLRTHFNIGDFEMIYKYSGTIVVSHLLAILIYLLVEAPVTILDRYFLTSLKIFPYPKQQKSKNEGYLETDNIIPSVQAEPASP